MFLTQLIPLTHLIAVKVGKSHKACINTIAYISQACKPNIHKAVCSQTNVCNQFRNTHQIYKMRHGCRNHSV